MSYHIVKWVGGDCGDGGIWLVKMPVHQKKRMVESPVWSPNQADAYPVTDPEELRRVKASWGKNVELIEVHS